MFVGLRPMCEALAISMQGQHAKLRTKPWATIKEILTVAEDGKHRAMAALHIDSIPMWLASIETNKVKEHARGKLVRYQMECARVLRDHFMPARRQAAEPALPGTAPAQARIGDDPRAHAEIAAWCKTAAKASGRTIQSIQGELRKPWGAASLYRVPLVALEHTRGLLQRITLAGPVRRLPADRRQLSMWGPS